MSNVFPHFLSQRSSPPQPGASRVGEHTQAVLAEDLEIGADEFARLAATGVFGTVAVVEHSRT
jgi:hypothetical protein